MIDLLMQFWRWLLSKFFGEKKAKPFATAIIEGQLPDILQDKTLYIVQEHGYFEQAAMLCPCSCGRVLHMNLLPDERPCWKATLHPDGTASLHPSVWRQKDCGSHFWFREGHVFWCSDKRQ